MVPTADWAEAIKSWYNEVCNTANLSVCLSIYLSAYLSIYFLIFHQPCYRAALQRLYPHRPGARGRNRPIFPAVPRPVNQGDATQAMETRRESTEDHQSS